MYNYYKYLHQGHRYLMGVDVSRGDSEDFSYRDIEPHFDLFLYKYDEKSNILQRITNTGFADEREGRVPYLSRLYPESARDVKELH